MTDEEYRIYYNFLREYVPKPLLYKQKPWGSIVTPTDTSRRSRFVYPPHLRRVKANTPKPPFGGNK